MPSLEQLEEFSSSFVNIGNEANSLSAGQYSRANFPLPGNEPPSPFPEDIAGIPETEPGLNDFDFSAFLNPPAPDIPVAPETEAAEFSPDLSGFGDSGLAEKSPNGPEETGDLEDLGEFGLPDDSEKAGEAGEAFPADLSDFGDFGLPEDMPGLPPESPAEMPVETSAVEAAGTEASGTEEGVGEIPPDLLSGFADDLESDGLPVNETFSVPGEDDSQFDFSTIDLSNAMDLRNEDGPVETSGPEVSGEGFDETAAETEDVPEAESLAAESPDIAFPDISDISADAGNEEIGEALPVLEAEDISPETAETPAAGEQTEISAFSDIGIPEPGSPAAEDAMEIGENDDAGNGDSFDAFNLGGESWTPPEDASLGTPDFDAPADDLSGSSFSLEGFDDFGSPETGAGFGPQADMASEDVEEIHLGEDEFRRLQETLSSYPLNLRIACEELIAEQAVAPDLMSAMIKLLVRGAPAKEAASLAGKILGRSIPIPRGFAKQTGADLEEEQASFGYIFVKKFLPVLRIFLLAALAAGSAGYLSWRFIINPFIANGVYKDGYERIFSGDYIRANELFRTAFERHRVKRWFYRYAEAFREQRNYERAAEKYDQLLRAYPRDKKGALDYAGMESYRQNFRKADEILRHNILDYAVNDREALTAQAENNLAWAEEDPLRYEEARAAYARLIARYGRQDPFLEGMLKYFIRTDNLGEVLPLQSYFMSTNKKRKISVPTLAELGGYLLDKRFAEVQARLLPAAEPRKVPDEYVDQIDGIRDILLRAIKEDPAIPESYYHLARYYNRYGSTNEERSALENAIRVFNAAEEGNPKRAGYRIDAYRRYAESLVNAGEFFPAEEQLVQGIRLFEDALARNILRPNPLFGRLYADLGDLAFYSQDGNMETALRHYREAEANGWASAEIQYRMGVAYYELSRWEEALECFFPLSGVVPNNRRLLYALGNVSYLRGNYFAAQGYYNRLMDLLDAERVRFPDLMPGGRPEEQELAERIMVADNNLGVTLETLTRITGNTSYRSRALGFFAESIRAWDVITRNPESMTRLRPIRNLYGPGINLAYLNAQNILNPSSGYDQQIFMRIDRDMPEPSAWEDLIPRDYRLSENLYTRE
ncbi:MAG: tetratricopeptide repeat protein [Treponema sp.]|jgi:tetratricopeptide (TPR) repeat protein|nr:tetratricopeptide repeat protein [Treponema sp.]